MRSTRVRTSGAALAALATVSACAGTPAHTAGERPLAQTVAAETTITADPPMPWIQAWGPDGSTIRPSGLVVARAGADPTTVAGAAGGSVGLIMHALVVDLGRPHGHTPSHTQHTRHPDSASSVPVQATSRPATPEHKSHGQKSHGHKHPSSSGPSGHGHSGEGHGHSGQEHGHSGEEHGHSGGHGQSGEEHGHSGEDHGHHHDRD